MNRWLFTTRDECIIEAFAGVSERRRQLTVVAIAVLSMVVFILFAFGQIQTFQDDVVFRTMMLAPTFLVVWMFWIGVMSKYRKVFVAFFARPSMSFVGFLFFLFCAISFSILIRGKTTIWWGTIDPLAVLIGPICEEFLYRFAFLYSMTTLTNRWVAIVASAVLFAGTHSVALPVFLATMVAGLFLSFLVMRFGSLLPSCCFHIIFNATAYLV